MNFKEDVQINLDFELSEQQLRQFDIYYTFLIEYNQITNLTRITEKNEVYYKHFYDSISVNQCLNFSKIDTLCDMGAGAGFPSIPLKILYPNIKLTIIDALGKRITFLDKLIKLLDLQNIELIHDRVEVYAKNHQNKFDLVTARAFGSLPEMIEMAIPMTKTKGAFIAMKSTGYQDEIEKSQNAINELSCQITKISTMDLPHNFGFRSNILFIKDKHVSGYPRSYIQIRKKTL